MRRFLLAILSVSALPVTDAAAQDALPASLPPEIAERIAARPDPFAGLAVDLLHGHGQGGAHSGRARAPPPPPGPAP